MPAEPSSFRYGTLDVDPDEGVLSCTYHLGDWTFTEQVHLGPGLSWDRPGVAEAARWVHLLAGVSYYKAAAPPVIDLGDVTTTPAQRDFLRTFYVEGLGEYAHVNGLDLTGLRIEGPERAEPDATRSDPAAPTVAPAGRDDLVDPGRPLVPFGGGIDSIVVAEQVRRHHPDATLFVLSRPGDRFAAIDAPAAVSGLPVRRVGRALDPQILASARLGFRNGHVPVTGILSAIAVLTAVLDGHGAVVMANEWSASAPTLQTASGRWVNHQWSKSMAFETAFRDALVATVGPRPAYFSALRARSELWVAGRFAALDGYLPVFRSCNKAFAQDPDRRLERWCGRCDKCLFIDVILAPYLPAARLAEVFDGAEPLADADLAPGIRALAGLSDDPKPFECVGDVDETRVALVLAARRPDRAGAEPLAGLAAEAAALLAAAGDDADAAASRLLAPLGEDFVPPSYRPAPPAPTQR